MSKLNNKSIWALEKRGITIGAIVKCACEARHRIEIKSYDDFEKLTSDSITEVEQ
jgi:hypothetical protein